MSTDVTSYPIKIKISVDFRCVANHMQMWLGTKMVISHFGYWHFLSTANTASGFHIYKKILQNKKTLKIVRLGWNSNYAYHVFANSGKFPKKGMSEPH